jgi:hypothetical protein
VPTLALPNIWQQLACQFFGQGILHPHLTNYLARFCETNSGTSIGSQNFSNKPNIDQNTIGNQFFGGANMGNEPNRPLLLDWIFYCIIVIFFMQNIIYFKCFVCDQVTGLDSDCLGA